MGLSENADREEMQRRNQGGMSKLLKMTDVFSKMSISFSKKITRGYYEL